MIFVPYYYYYYIIFTSLGLDLRVFYSLFTYGTNYQIDSCEYLLQHKFSPQFVSLQLGIGHKVSLGLIVYHPPLIENTTRKRFNISGPN